MKTILNNKRIIYIVLTILIVLLLLIELTEILREFTLWPPYIRKKPLTPEQGEQYESISVYKYFPLWFPSSFFYFTTWTNVLVFGSMFYSIVLKKKISFAWRTSLMINAFITFTVFVLFIAPYLPWGNLGAWFDFIYIHEHLNMFIITSVWYFLTFGKEESNIKKSMKISMIVPLIYLFWSTIVYIICQGKVAIYTFLDWQRPFGIDIHPVFGIYVTIVFLLVLTFVIVGLAWLLSRHNNRIYSKAIVNEIKNTL